ncbi:MAG: CinA family nicotinamide mononucleotide deamidase-related protein [Muribaculaceae bacterium]|nr:CinA family nicotinamide mononucleotide deamidase-related protein [Muribaculaceae bacterium]
MLLSIIVIGDELLIGQVTDTNSGWIARNINPIGWTVKSVRVVADDAVEIKNAIDEAFKETDLVLTTGGLGPTKDDITKETLRQIFGGEMIYDKATEANVLEVVNKRHLKINPLTAAQAYVPSSCRVIQNKVGTAPIMWFEKGEKVLVSMPGVPFETETMMSTEIIPQLIAHFNAHDYIEHRTFVVIDYSESVLAMKLDDFETHIPDYIKLAYLPKPGLIRLRLTGVHKDKSILEQNIENLSAELTSILGKSIISYQDLPLSKILGNELERRNFTISTAESCTGGYIAHQITQNAGCSAYFKGSIVCYSNDVKMNLLGVESTTLEKDGAVSENTVIEMVKGVSKLINTDCAIAISGIAGPDGGSETKPVGTVWISVKCKNIINTSVFHFPGDRMRVIDRATMEAEKMSLKLILNS